MKQILLHAFKNVQTDIKSDETIQYDAFGRVLGKVKPNKQNSFRRKTNSVHSDGCAVINWIDMKCIALMHQDTQLQKSDNLQYNTLGRSSHRQSV